MSIQKARELVEKLKALDRTGAVFTVEQMETLLARREDILEMVRHASLALLDRDLALVHKELATIAEACGGRLGPYEGIKSR